MTSVVCSLGCRMNNTSVLRHERMKPKCLITAALKGALGSCTLLIYCIIDSKRHYTQRKGRHFSGAQRMYCRKQYLLVLVTNTKISQNEDNQKRSPKMYSCIINNYTEKCETEDSCLCHHHPGVFDESSAPCVKGSGTEMFLAGVQQSTAAPEVDEALASSPLLYPGTGFTALGLQRLYFTVISRDK